VETEEEEEEEVGRGGEEEEAKQEEEDPDIRRRGFSRRGLRSSRPLPRDRFSAPARLFLRVPGPVEAEIVGKKRPS
jgi:hypothetical protein